MVIKCPECNHYVSDTVHVCPYCGYDLKSVETSSSDTQETTSIEEKENCGESFQNIESQNPTVYDIEKRSNSKKYIIPIVLGCLVIAGIAIGLSHSSQDNEESLIVATDSVVEIVDSVAEETIPVVSFAIIPVTSNQETDDINTSVSIDFPQTNNEYLQDVIVSFIIKALTNDFTWGENSRPSYHGDMSDGQAIADFFVNEKVREISEERAQDSIESMPWFEEISIKKICETDRLLSYEVDFGGSHGGVGGGTTYGATFSKIDCNVIPVIANTSDPQLKSFLIKYIHSHLDSDTKEMIFEEDLNNHPYPNKEPFITDKGVRFIYQKYEIGAGALGVVDITIPFSDIADYMSEEALSLIGYNKD